MTVLRSFGVSAPDLGAAAQQLAVIQGIYRDARSRIEAFLGSDGTILRWVHQRDTWPPSWCLIRSGEGRYFLAMEGTTSLRQFAGHALGTFALDVFQGTGKVNGQWKLAWEAISAEVDEAIGSPESVQQLHVSGHSYGGALALLAGVEWSGRIGPGNVQVMSFGAPRAFDANTVISGPDTIWRYESENDVVPTLPPDALYVAPVPFVPVSLAYFVAWKHFGKRVSMGRRGHLEF